MVFSSEFLMMKKIYMKKTNGKVSTPTQNRSGQPSSIMCPPASHPSCPSHCI
ncbi:hypothetical protein DEO72_LG1g2186 [Vigna unguiculata]|uniref:Uncharacterized protein n=1 Tax=Vigna unguiculata TaxID=3917 RepID=A0A4D6KPE8_VIGUN|nr:hypothetical protein DEO72_LG1g2186 [Vigna unguiculata]